MNREPEFHLFYGQFLLDETFQHIFGKAGELLTTTKAKQPALHQVLGISSNLHSEKM